MSTNPSKQTTVQNQFSHIQTSKPQQQQQQILTTASNSHNQLNSNQLTMNQLSQLNLDAGAINLLLQQGNINVDTLAQLQKVS